ncbi:MAG: hypothetical protein COA91_08470 [Robiginitomaculum sp.]|nr:MAG: hypothetical protein COA91_08470 [Robiginitomaculum sp.]
MSVKEIAIITFVLGGMFLLLVTGQMNWTGKSTKGRPMLSPAADFSDMAVTRKPMVVVKTIMTARKTELAEQHDIKPRDIYLSLESPPVLTKGTRRHKIKFQMNIRGVSGLYSENYRVVLTKKRMFKILDVKYEHKCTLGKVVQKWTTEPCAIEREPNE